MTHKKDILTLALLSLAATSAAQDYDRREAYKTGVPLADIIMSDPFVMADPATQTYYMTGTGGMLWTSKDLARWDGPSLPFAVDTASWMGPRPHVWAAELHPYKGRYHYFATFTNPRVMIDTVAGRPVERRACHVLTSATPAGPYTPQGDATYLPATKPTLDATLWVEDGVPYMVYCHEWIQNLDGTVERIRLKDDLSGTVGEARVLFRASDSPWSREDAPGSERPNKVTDGPFLFRTATGRLGMIWTSWVRNVYTQGVAYSTTGRLDGPWVQEPQPITPPNYGHGMLFRTLGGEWLMSVHSHYVDAQGRYIRRPHFFRVDLGGDKLVVGEEWRPANYRPDGRAIVCTDGKNRYTRALYSAHSHFRVETSDVPVFAIFQNKKECCNLSFTVSVGGVALRLDSAEHCTARYEAGLRSYAVGDSRWGGGEVRLTAVADKRREGGLWRLEAVGFKEAVGVEASLCETATQKFPRQGDMGSFHKKGCYEASPCRKNLRTASLTLAPTAFLAVDGGAKATLLSDQASLAARYAEAEADRQALASRVEISTPDPYLNTLGGNLVAAADGAWDGETWQHGAVGWRMPLPGWRAAYAGDFLGWPARQESHFAAYAASMVTGEPVRLPHEQDSTHNLARGAYRWGTPMYSDGYICRSPRNNHQFHHYDMNLAYMDELMWHFQFAADTAAMRRLWPTVKSHLAWEKRAWDPDGDGLYDAYCCIWASDALQYHSGAVAHSSAYNYRANLLAARMATLLGEDPTPYAEEADKTLKAMDAQLWMADKGVWAECKDFMGLGRLHDSPALWTVYTAIDSRACTPRQAWEATRWVDGHTPHIPFTHNDKTYETLATTHWEPYEWSINNVAMAEVMHTALAYYEAGRPEEATRLLTGCVIDFQYAGASPGNFGQLSRLDRHTGEGYRDFADVVGISSRTVVQGLFGITPQAMEGRCYVRPGFPAAWDSASIHTPYMDYTFRRSGGKDTHEMRQRFAQPLQIVLQQNLGEGATIDHIGTADSLVRFEVPTMKVEEPRAVAATHDEGNPSAEPGEVDARRCETVDITAAMNASVTDIFKNEYLSPRSPYTTLALPKQGIGDWCSTKRTADIDDAFLRASGGKVSVAGVPFATPTEGDNVIYTSLWDNYPDSVTIDLRGKASRLHLLMAGSTNPMQSQFVNGEATLTYADGTTTVLPLRNPDNWCPIEQDYDSDPWAFRLPQPRPFRLALKTGQVSRTLAEDMGAATAGTSSDEPSGKRATLAIPGGAAQLLTLEADPRRKLRSLTLKTTANDVVVGLLGLTVERAAKHAR